MKDEKTYTFDQIGMILMLISFAMVALAIAWKSEKDIEELNRQLDHKQFQIDSLRLEMDTLEWENEIYDYNKEHDTNHLLSALMFVESGNNDSAHAIGEDAVGVLQIRKTMVDDVNRILKRQGKDYKFTYDDRWLRNKSIQMFDIYCKHYGLTTAEEIARCWNGGPRGMNKDATVYYWNKVQEEMNS